MSEWTVDRAGEFLRQGRWFAQQPEEFCAAVLSRSEIRTYGAHQRICQNGSPPSGVYAVLEGQVNLVAEREPGASLFYNFLEPGSWFGQGNCLDREPFLLDAVTPHRTVVLHFPLSDFDDVLEQHPAYYRCWALILTEAWRTTLGHYLDSKTFEARRRVNQELLLLATRVGQPCGDGHPPQGQADAERFRFARRGDTAICKPVHRRAARCRCARMARQHHRGQGRDAPERVGHSIHQLRQSARTSPGRLSRSDRAAPGPPRSWPGGRGARPGAPAPPRSPLPEPWRRSPDC